MNENGQARAWSYDDDELFEDDEKVAACCGQPIRVGQVIQERPAFSMAFYHCDTTDCDES